MYNQPINRCQPGYGASCSLCCGSHNFIESTERTKNILFERGQNCNTDQSKDPETSDYPKLFADAIQCPHVGIQSCEYEKIGCLIYDEDNLPTKLGSFFKGTCKNFHCPAWDSLSDEQIIFAARLMEDWYYYSLFINYIEAVQELHATYSDPEDVPADELDILKEELLEKYIDEDGK